MSAAAPVSEPMRPAGANPFSMGAVLALVGLGSAIFVALLWMIGSGMTGGSANDGGAHAGGHGLNGFAGFARLVELRGNPVRQVRSDDALAEPGLLVLTPPADAKGEDIERIVAARRGTGPTIVVTPKWRATPFPGAMPGAKPGWVGLDGTQMAKWPGFLDDVGLQVGAMGSTARWSGMGASGRLPVAEAVQSGLGDRLVPLVRGQDGRILAAYLDDSDSGSDEEWAEAEEPERHPLVLVFEPDLIDNYGLARMENALLALALLAATAGDEKTPVMFDLTLNGHVRSANLLTLAFTPPFLAATLCLLMAAVAVGWRALLRFGAPVAAGRAIAFGKRALVANSAGLLRRTRRFHLISGPYLRRSRERIARALALPPLPGAAETDAAIDRVTAARHPDLPPYSAIAARVAAARKAHDLLAAARDLHALERKLIR